MISTYLSLTWQIEGTHSVDQVKLPVCTFKGLESYRVGIVVERQRSLNGTLDYEQALCTKLVRQNLNGVADKQAGPRHRIHDIEHPDEKDHGIVGAGASLLFIESSGQGPKDKGDKHASG